MKSKKAWTVIKLSKILHVQYLLTKKLWLLYIGTESTLVIAGSLFSSKSQLGYSICSNIPEEICELFIDLGQYYSEMAHNMIQAAKAQ